MKLIEKSAECGYRKQVFTRLGLPSGMFVCAHPSKVIGDNFCSKSQEFPSSCPLEDAVPKKSVHWP